MKTKLFALLLMLITLSASAQKTNPVTMVSFEQGWMDDVSTLALKNNTEHTINEVKFIIEYFDMNGVSMDYKDFEKKVVIPAGKTKKIDIPAYEHRRYYSYYKSEAYPMANKRFKVDFTLNEYTFADGQKTKISDGGSTHDEIVEDEIVEDEIVEDEIVEDSEATELLYDDDTSGGAPLIGIGITGATVLAMIAILVLGFGLFVIVAVMAKHRNRNVALWVLLSFVTTPLICIIILLAIGNDEGGRERY